MNEGARHASATDQRERIAPLSRDIAERLKTSRHALGLSQEEFAQRLGVTRQTISNWECARTIPDAVSLGHIARVCNTTADELLGTDATRIRESTLSARREFILVCGIVLVLQLITMLLNGIAVSTDDPDWGGGCAFAAFRLGVLVIGCLWIWRIARREGLATIRQMIDFASLASAHPGGRGDRALHFIGHWFWTLWIASSAVMYLIGGVIAIVAGKAEASTLVAPAFMLLIASIPYTWERNAPR